VCGTWLTHMTHTYTLLTHCTHTRLKVCATQQHTALTHTHTHDTQVRNLGLSKIVEAAVRAVVGARGAAAQAAQSVNKATCLDFLENQSTTRFSASKEERTREETEEQCSDNTAASAAAACASAVYATSAAAEVCAVQSRLRSLVPGKEQHTVASLSAHSTQHT
jgi:hypothetical protein